ncbi:hypothetical protein MNB_SM-6-1119 [hydrothermal vent metagenome]|uniref:Uncharacterized protein n=1 Tax=hydrothermal vent metagenome TaxID=652676 RepID=A0A1W1BKM2_9ZZZZ
MDIILLVKSIVGLVIILGILILFFLYTPTSKKKLPKKKKNSYVQKIKKESKPEIKELLEVIRNKNASTKELTTALDTIIKYYGKIHPKLGIRTHPDFDIYSEILLRICRHPNTTKDIIINFDKELEKRNPEYVREINDSLTKGLNSRGL